MWRSSNLARLARIGHAIQETQNCDKPDCKWKCVCQIRQVLEQARRADDSLWDHEDAKRVQHLVQS